MTFEKQSFIMDTPVLGPTDTLNLPVDSHLLKSQKVGSLPCLGVSAEPNLLTASLFFEGKEGKVLRNQHVNALPLEGQVLNIDN